MHQNISRFALKISLYLLTPGVRAMSFIEKTAKSVWKASDVSNLSIDKRYIRNYLFTTYLGIMLNNNKHKIEGKNSINSFWKYDQGRLTCTCITNSRLTAFSLVWTVRTVDIWVASISKKKFNLKMNKIINMVKLFKWLPPRKWNTFAFIETFVLLVTTLGWGYQ